MWSSSGVKSSSFTKSLVRWNSITYHYDISWGTSESQRSSEPGVRFLNYQFLFHRHMWIRLLDISHTDLLGLLLWLTFIRLAQILVGWELEKRLATIQLSLGCMISCVEESKIVAWFPGASRDAWLGMIKEREVVTPSKNPTFTLIELLTPVSLRFESFSVVVVRKI